MSDTPRTDSHELPCGWDTTHPVVKSEFSRELERELAEKDRQLTAALKGKRPFSSKFADEVIEGQKKQIEELEKKLNGWFTEREALKAALKPFAAHATCHGPDDARCGISVTLGSLRAALKFST